MKNTSASQLTLDGSIAGDRVCLTHVEDKSRAGIAGGALAAGRAAHRVPLYASLAECAAARPS